MTSVGTTPAPALTPAEVAAVLAMDRRSVTRQLVLSVTLVEHVGATGRH